MMLIHYTDVVIFTMCNNNDDNNNNNNYNNNSNNIEHFISTAPLNEQWNSEASSEVRTRTNELKESKR